MPESVDRRRRASSSPQASNKRVKLDGKVEALDVFKAEVVEGTKSGTDDMSNLTELVEQEMTKDIEVAKSYEKEIDYENKLVLAPMVRTGSLPTRLLSLYYQAGLVWGPEVVDKAIIGAERLVDAETGVITYSKKGGDGKPIFQCHPVEKPFLIFQIGTSDPELAAQAAKVVEQDVAGFDLNCGCPKPFSVHSGMGAALLSTPDLLLSILRSLLSHTSLPVSCKIRLLPEQPSTLHLAARILRTGVRCLTVHCRTRDQRSSTRALWERLGEIVELGRRRNIPILCNGDGEGWSNWEDIRKQTGVQSVMIARAAESNPSIFRPQGPVSTAEELIPKKFLPLVVFIKNHYSNTKFLLSQFKPSSAPISTLNKQEKQFYSRGVASAKTIEEALELWKLNKDDCKKEGEAFIKELRLILEEREPTAYSSKPAEDLPDPTKNVWTQRKEAEEEGNVVDEPEQVKTKEREEEDDEEAMLNA